VTLPLLLAILASIALPPIGMKIVPLTKCLSPKLNNPRLSRLNSLSLVISRTRLIYSSYSFSSSTTSKVGLDTEYPPIKASSSAVA